MELHTWVVIGLVVCAIFYIGGAIGRVKDSSEQHHKQALRDAQRAASARRRDTVIHWSQSAQAHEIIARERERHGR